MHKICNYVNIMKRNLPCVDIQHNELATVGSWIPKCNFLIHYSAYAHTKQMQHTYDKYLNILYLINLGQNYDEFDSDWYRVFCCSNLILSTHTRYFPAKFSIPENAFKCCLQRRGYFFRRHYKIILDMGGALDTKQSALSPVKHRRLLIQFHNVHIFPYTHKQW